MFAWIMRRQFALLLAALIFSAVPAQAHDIPVDAAVQTFIKPEGHVLHVLMRVPLTTYTDAEYPHRPGDYVELTTVDPSLRAAATVVLLENLSLYEGDRKLPDPRIVSARLSLDSDRSFASYEQALAHVMGPPLPPQTNVLWEQTKLDVLFDYPIQSENSYFSIHAGFDRLALHEITPLTVILTYLT